jgi:flagellar motor switch protein FliN/FliY
MADDPEPIGQQEIDELLQQAKQAAQQSSAPSSEPRDYSGMQQDEVHSLLRDGGAAPGEVQATGAQAAVSSPAAASSDLPTMAPPQSTPSGAGSAGDDVQFLLDQADQALASVDETVGGDEGLAPFQYKDFTGSPPSEDKATLDLLRDVELDVKIELGRTDMYLEDILKLRRGSVVALDKLAGDPVDIYVNGRLIARGEVLVLNDNFCVRVAELISGDEIE